MASRPADPASRVASLEAELREQQLLLRFAAGAGGVGMFRWNVETDDVWMSPELPPLYDLDVEGVVAGAVFRSRLHPDDVPLVMAAAAAAQSGTGEFYCEFRVRTRAGGERWLAGRGRFLEQPDGSRRMLMGANWDITAAKSEATKIRSILDGLGALAGLMTVDGTLIEANKVALEAGGLAPEDVLGKPFWETSWWNYDAGLQKQLCHAIAAAAAGEVMRFDARVRGAGGTFIDIDFTLSPLRDHTGKIVNLIPSAFEITSRKQAEERARLVNRELQHRIANVFTVVTSLLRLSAGYGGDVPSFVEATTERLRALEAAHRAPGSEVAAELAALAHQVLRPWRELPGSRLTVAGPRVDLSRGQATALALVFHELATNATKHGGLRAPSASVEVSWQELLDQLEVTWRERGVGAVAPPARKGFGLTVIETLAEDYLDGTASFEFGADGLTARIVWAR